MPRATDDGSDDPASRAGAASGDVRPKPRVGVLRRGLALGLVALSPLVVAAQSPSLVLSETSLDVPEAGSASYTVKLATLPTADVTVSIGGTANTDLSLNKTSLTFTTANWDTTQSVRVSAAQDSDALNDTATLTHTATGGGYGTVSANLPVMVTDTTRMRLVAVVENVPEGESKPIRARLPMPLDVAVTITVTVAPNGGRADEYELSTNTTLTIAAGTTESTGEVIFTSLDDFTQTGTRYFDATLTSDHPRVDADTEAFAVIDDDHTITVLQVTPSKIFENGGTATLRGAKIRLHEGVVKMTVSLEPSDRATLSGTTLTFQPGALYATETLTITAVDNAADEPDQTITISATVTEGRGIRTPGPLQLTIVDDEEMSPEVALVLTPPRVREGLASTVTAVASGPLDDEATITVSASPGHADTGTDDYVLSANTVLTIPSGGTRSTGTVTIATVDDPLNGGSRRRVVTVSGTVTGGGVAAPADQTLTVLEDDRPVLVSLIATPATIAEGGVSTITMRSLQPMPADVTVTLSEFSEAVELSADPVLMIAEGETESTGLVTLTAVEDADMINEVVFVGGVPSPDSAFVRVNFVQVYILDDDATSARVVVSPVPANLFEGETSTVIAALTRPLSDDVTVTIGVDEANLDHTATADEYTLSANRTLTIPAGQTRSTGEVTFTAANDEYYGPLFHRRVVLDISVTGIERNQVIKHSDVNIFEDEDAPRVTLEATPASISEHGGQSTVTARLNTKVASDVEVTISAAPVGTTESDDFTQIGTQLTIPAGEKTSTGTVTIRAVDDDVDGPDKNLVVTGAVDVVGMEESGLVWHPYAEGVTIRDDDESGLTVSPPTLTIDEGDDGTYTVVLKSEPPGTVEVSVSGTAGTDLTLSTPSLTFTPSNWNVAQMVTVTAGQDDDASDDMEMLTHTASRSDYGALALPVTVTDDEGRSGGGDDDGDDEPNRPPAFDQSYTFDLRENRSGREVPVVLGTVGARDPDGDDMHYSLFAGDRDRFTVSRDSGTVSYIGQGEDFELGPSRFELQVTANDGQYQTRGRVVVRVVDVAEGPEAGDDEAETPEDTPTVIDVLSNDRHPDGDRLRMASVGAAEHGTTAVVSDGVRYAPELNWHGTDRFTYTVSDESGLTATATVTMTVLPVNDAPEAVDDEAETLEDEAVVVDVLVNDTDADGDPIRVVSVGPAGHGATTMAPHRVRYSPDPNWHGTDRFVYTIADPDGLTATATVTMTVLPVNDAPEAAGVIPDQALEEGGAPVTVDLTPYFTDVDGDVLTYTAVSPDETAVTVTVAGATLTLSAVVTGTATVTVTASDGEGLTATQSFGVQVGDRLVRAVMTDTLAALGRGHLSSARATIGRHLEMGGSEATRVMVGGQVLSLDAWDRMGAGGLEQSHELLFRAAQLRQRLSATDLVGTSAAPRLGRSGPGLMGGAFGGGWDRLLQGTDVLLSFGGQDQAAGPSSARGRRWTVWGQGDLQTFRGAETEHEDYDGDLRTGYLGLDARLGEKWLVGAAVARSGGGGDWRVGASSGRLTTALTVVHPYLRWGDRDTSVWALAGIGLGSAENIRMLTGKRETSPLRLGVGLLEGRRRLATTGAGLTVDLRGEASWARLRTGGGEETVDGLEAGVRRVRTGVEVTLALGDPSGLQLAPFGAVSTRHDGGDGQTGVGLEVAGGVRLTGGRVRVEAQGRMLALHTATDYQERGVSVTASVGAGQYEPGLTASIRPRWGAQGYGAEALWQDQFQSYTYGAERDDAAVDGRVGYGLQLPGGLLLTPFGGYGQMGTWRRTQVGATLGRLGLFGGGLDSPLQVEFLSERYVRPQGVVDHRFTLFGIVTIGAPSR